MRFFLALLDRHALTIVDIRSMSVRGTRKRRRRPQPKLRILSARVKDATCDAIEAMAEREEVFVGEIVRRILDEAAASWQATVGQAA